MREPKLKDSYRLHKNEHHPIGKLNEDIVRKIGEQIIYMIYIGRKDLCGDDWGALSHPAAEVIFQSILPIQNQRKNTRNRSFRCLWS